RRQRRERRMAFDVREVHAGALDLVDPGVRRNGVWPAPPARAEPGVAGGLRRLEERDILAPGPTARARRTAVDACRLDGVDEQPVRAAIVLDHRVPSREVVQLFACIVSSWYVVSGFSRTCLRWHRVHAPSIAPLMRSHYPVLAIELYVILDRVRIAIV